MDYTTNYQLPVWAKTDRILMEDFNDLTGAIEEALSGLRDDVDANTSGLSANTTAHAGFGNCQLYLTSYVGTGSGTCTFTVPGNPVMVMALGPSQALWAVRGLGSGTNLYGGESSLLTVSFTGQTVSWTSSNYNNGTGACNYANTAYVLLALLEK